MVTGAAMKLVFIEVHNLEYGNDQTSVFHLNMTKQAISGIQSWNKELVLTLPLKHFQRNGFQNVKARKTKLPQNAQNPVPNAQNPVPHFLKIQVSSSSNYHPTTTTVAVSICILNLYLIRCFILSLCKRPLSKSGTIQCNVVGRLQHILEITSAEKAQVGISIPSKSSGTCTGPDRLKKPACTGKTTHEGQSMSLGGLEPL